MITAFNLCWYEWSVDHSVECECDFHYKDIEVEMATKMNDRNMNNGRGMRDKSNFSDTPINIQKEEGGIYKWSDNSWGNLQMKL